MNRKSSSADEFFDAVESIDELPSSSCEDSFSRHGNELAAASSVDSSCAVGEKEGPCVDEIPVEAAASTVANGEAENSNGTEEIEAHNELQNGHFSDVDNENWVSARCLSVENSQQNRSDSQSSIDNWVSARCLLENGPIPSLMDVVSSSVSNDEVDRGDMRAALQQHMEANFNSTSVDPPGERFSQIEESDGLDEAQDAEEEVKIKAEQSSLVESGNEMENSNKLTTGECHESIDQVNLHNELNGKCRVGHDDKITTEVSQEQVVKHHSNTEDTVPLQDENNMDTAESSITNEEAAELTATANSDGEESNEGTNLTDIPRTSSLFLPVESDSDLRTNVERPDTPDNQQSTDPNISQGEDAHFSTPLHQNTQRIDDCSVLDYCNLTSPLEALYLMCSNQKKGGTLLRKESGEDIVDTAQNFASPEKMTSVRDVDPEGPTPMSPPEESDAAVNESGSDDDSSSAASFTSINKFRIVDRDTGNIFDVREIMRDIDEVGESLSFDTRYSFLPSKRELQRRTVLHGNDMNLTEDGSFEGMEGPQPVGSFDSLSSVSIRDSPGVTMSKSYNSSGSAQTKKKAKAKLSDLKQSIAGKLTKSSLPTLNRKRTASSDAMPRNAIYVKSTTRHNSSTKTSSSDLASGHHAQSSSFNPMLLVKTIPASHDGPAWCAAFSLDGRFLATGGEDGNVCIWAVAPKSAAVHPENAGAPDKSEMEPGPSNSEKEDSEMPDVGNDSPLTTKTDDKSADRVAYDTTPLEEASPPQLSFVGSGPELATNLEIISEQPLQRFDEHTADVIDLSWSHTNFLLTASLDSSVRLYHYSKPACLHLFKHADLVASVAFHPSDERYFISGGVDKKLRMWSITDGRVKDWAQAPDVITAVRFTPDGKYAVAGLFRGQVYFYSTDGLKYYTQIACRNRSGKYKLGRKVTGISFVRGERDDWAPRKNSTAGSEVSSTIENSFHKISEAGSRVVKRISLPFKGNGSEVEALRYTERMLVTTNDSRVRLYNLNDFCLVRKYKGHANYSMQIRARTSESGDYIASGSESGHVFLWKTLDKEWMAKHNISIKLHQTKDKAKSSDYFEASKAQLPIVTDSVFFPYRSVKESLLSSQLFPFKLSMDRVNDDLSSAALLTLDYDGTMRVFLRKSCIDNLLDAATPRGGRLA